MSEFIIYVDGESHIVNIGENGTATVGEKNHLYELIPLNHTEYLLRIDNKFHQIHLSTGSPEETELLVNGTSYILQVRTALQEKAAALIGKMSFDTSITEVKAPMPGMILKIHKKSGDQVKQGESLLILEAMKMENDLRSPVSGVIKDIFIKEGSPVEKGAILFSIL